MKITEAKFLKSAVDESGIIKDERVEIAFVGRSNVGKSSLINSLCGQKNLAKTSSTTGLTKTINYFLINNLFRLVDLPGYGYAKTGKNHIANWAGLIEKYLVESKSLRVVFVLVDCRHEPTELDHLMLEFLKSYQIPFIVVATKVDKIAKSKVSQACNVIAKQLALRKEMIFPYSAQTSFGKEQLLEYLEGVLA